MGKISQTPEGKLLLWRDDKTSVWFGGYLPEDEDKAQAFLREMKADLNSWVGPVLEARQRFGVAVPNVTYTVAYTEGARYLGMAADEGITIFVNKFNGPLIQYNCFKHAIVFHESAHFTDLSRRAPERLKLVVETKDMVENEDPSFWAEWVYDEYRANLLLPKNDIYWMYQMASTFIFGEDASNLFENAENSSPSFGYSFTGPLSTRSRSNNLKALLPVYMAAQELGLHPITGLFYHSLEKVSPDFAIGWKVACKAGRERTTLRDLPPSPGFCQLVFLLDMANYHFGTLLVAATEDLARDGPSARKWIQEVADEAGLPLNVAPSRVPGRSGMDRKNSSSNT